MAGSDIQYAESGCRLDIAESVREDRPVDLVLMSGFITFVEWPWGLPESRGSSNSRGLHG